MSGAYAALLSLTQTIHTIRSHTRHSFSFDDNQIDSLLEIARFFLEFVESNSYQGKSEEVKDLEIRIASAARLAEDVLESRAVDQIDRGENNPGYSSDLEEILQNIMHPIKEKVENIKEEISRVKDEEATDFTAAASSSRSSLTAGTSSVVGVDDYYTQIMDQLTSQQSSRHIIPIVGMGGIGKTTLAQHIFYKPLVKQHFDTCAWATVSQEHDAKEILSQLLSRDAESSRDAIDELGEQLHKKLSGRRYLIVLDDIWSMEAWDEIKNYFPDNGNGSRIVITTRLSNVANNLSSSSIAMDVLDEETSWKLFCASIFVDEECPSELVEIGKKIAKRCGGLPLAIVTIARLLKKSSRTEKRWGEVAQDMISYLNSGEEQFMSIFSLSYNHLPAHLKPCFLYLGNFPQGKEILVSTLVRSWIAEGYIRGNGSESLEEIGEGYLRDLVDRNLISVEEKGWNGRLSTCRIHDLLRDVCLKVGEEEKFFCVSKHPAAASRCRSASCLICSTRRSSKYKDESRLLRILPKAEVELDEDAFDPNCLVPVSNHLNMRDSYCHLYWERSPESLPLDRRRTAPQIRSRLPYIPLPSSLSSLWNLQTLVIHGVFARILAPVEIWEMPQLRHVDVFDLISIPDPPRFDHTSSVVMQNLQTLLVVENFKLTEEVCRRIPNIKELQMYYNLDESSSSSSGYSQQNLNRFHRLESLRCEFDEGSNWHDFTLDFTFPHSLKKLWLGGSGLHWEDLSMIGSLPRLEALTLSCKNAVRGNEWNPVEGEFQRLKSLAIYHCEDLVRWNAESSHFPVLESLTIGHAYELVEFPSDIGDIPTLSRVYLDRCSVSAAVSAMRMLKEQEEMGNDELVLVEDMRNHPRLSTSLDNKQIESLTEKVHFMLNFIEAYDSRIEAEDLEMRIAAAAQEAEDVIESRIVDRILAGSKSSSLSLNLQKKMRDLGKKVQSKDAKSRLQRVIKEMDSIKEIMAKIEVTQVRAGFRDELVLSTSSRPLIASRKSTMVGFDEELIQLMDVLTSQKSSRQIISIVAMGGAGKTTLTRNAYENSLIEQHFDILAWATVSQEYSARGILLQLLSYGKSITETDEKLGEELYKKLLGNRYLIVLDDMWSIDAWDEMRFFLPDNSHRSRVIVTTRLSNLADRVSSSSFVMNFLDKDKSWKLFCEKAFGEDDCPPELVEIGKEIVEKCKGLPLSIVAIGGYLSKSSRSKEHWEYIASDINEILCSDKDDQCLRILYMSYRHLPVYIKPCFLYMGIFKEDEEISIDGVIQLWIAEGFLRPNKVLSLEDMGESFMKDLIDRNLILVHSWGHNGKVLYCKIHDLVREVCLKEAEKEKFLCVLKSLDSETPKSISSERRVAIQRGTLDEEYFNSSLYHALKSAPLLRSFICDTHNLPFDFRLLKIQVEVSECPNGYDVDCLNGSFSKQVNLRYLHHSLYFGGSHLSLHVPYVHLPSSISQLWNLQTLILGGNFQRMIAPPEIWEMPQLRHLFFNLILLPYPPPNDQQHVIVLRNLQTLSKVENLKLGAEVCTRIPNIKNLHIKYGAAFINSGLEHCLYNLGCLHKLEVLTCTFAEKPISHDFAHNLTFSNSLKELCLIRCILRWEDLTIVGSLPFLEVLKLRFSIEGREWNPLEGEFLRLNYLEVWCCDDLVKWNAKSLHFPVLESLAFRHLPRLEEIPSGIGEIPTLQHIHLEQCSVSSTISAMRTLIEQENLGNQGFQLRVRLWRQEDHQKFKEMLQEEGLNSNNLRLSNYIYDM